jgi:hypothetical protein
MNRDAGRRVLRGQLSVVLVVAGSLPFSAVALRTGIARADTPGPTTA